MTIGIGFKCRDGIVLATDTKYTQGDYKSHGPKLFTLFAPHDLPDLAVVIAGAGTVPFMKGAVAKIEEHLRELDAPNDKSVQRTIESTLLEYFALHVFPRPSHWDQVYVELLIGLWTRHDGFTLLASDDTNVLPVTHYGTAARAIGLGKYVADYALGLVFDVGFTLVQHNIYCE